MPIYELKENKNLKKLNEMKFSTLKIQEKNIQDMLQK